MTKKTEVNQYDKIKKVLTDGGIIAYPTEGVYGLGCDPFNEKAVLRLLKLKERSVEMGLILIAHNWTVLKTLVKEVPKAKLDKAQAASTGKPVTWIFPVKEKTPTWIKGKFDSIAIRVTTHPIANEICKVFGGPIVSTSANLSGEPPCHTADEVKQALGDKIDLIVEGEVLNKDGQPSSIIDVLTDEKIR